MAELQINRIDKAIEYVSPRWGLKRAEQRMRIELAASMFRGSSKDRLRSDWNTRSLKDTTPEAWELDTLRQRSRDANRNDPVASSATDTMGGNIIGQGLRPQSRMRYSVLGISKEEARKLQVRTESLYSLWSRTADLACKLTFNELQFLALRKVIEDGEIISIPAWAPEPWRKFGRACELVEADRLGGTYLVGKGVAGTGIEVNDNGAPQKYWIRKANHQSLMADTQEFVGYRARDASGRPMVLHVFPTKRVGQLRGWPHFAPVLTYFKDLADYMEASVVSARIAACLAVFITQNDPAYGAAANSKKDSKGQRLQTLEPGLVHYMNKGEEPHILDPSRNGEAFDAFFTGLLRLIGNAIGMPYEIFFKDFSKTNYSSARASLLEGRRMFMNWRAWFSEKFCQPYWALLIEEAYLRGMFEAPNFYENFEEYTRCQWIGGAWGWVDPVKEGQAAKNAVDYNLSTLAEENAANGRDWEEVLEQRADELALAKELGVPILSGSGASATPLDTGKNTDPNGANNGNT